MNDKEIKNKLEELKSICPDASFCSSSREKIISYAILNANKNPEDSQLKNRWVLFLQPVAMAFVVLVLVLGSRTFFPAKVENSEISSIKNEWKLADISPYIEDIFEEKIDQDGGSKTASLDLAKNDNTNQIMRKKPISNLNLGITEVDRAIDSLTF